MHRIVHVFKRIHWPTAGTLLVQFGIGLGLRISFISWESWDYKIFISGWYDFIARNGFHAFASHFSNYNPPYLYLLWIATLLPLQKLVAIKSISILFDTALAALAAWFAYRVHHSQRAGVLTFTAMFFLPTLVMNGSLWGQSDVVYTFFVVAAVLALYDKRPWLGTVLWALALAIKLQAIFIAPLMLILLLRRHIQLRHLAVIPVVLILSLAPSALAGRPLGALATIYRDQAATYEDLTLHAPSIYQWLPSQPAHLLATTGILWCAALMVCLVYVGAKQRSFTQDHILRWGLLCSVLVPFLLPHMHDRYFFIADILAVVYAIVQPRMIFIPLTMQIVSGFSYIPFLFGIDPPISFVYLSAIVAALGLYLIWSTLRPSHEH